MKKNNAALTIMPIEASTSAVFAREDNHGNDGGYKNENNNTPRYHGGRCGRTILKSINKKIKIYGILIAVLVSTLLTGCYMYPPSGVGIYVPPVGVSVYTPPLHYGGPHYRPHHWRRHRPHRWHR